MNGHLVSRSHQEEAADPFWPCGNRILDLSLGDAN